MKLLFDQNLSEKLIRRLEDIFPNSRHVKREGMSESMDGIIWTYAQKHDFTIVSKDEDFVEISTVKGFPPNIIWLRCGNTSTAHIEAVLRENTQLIHSFEEENKTGILELQ